MPEFLDSRLEDRDVLTRADPLLRRLATAGARIRVEWERAEGPLASLDLPDRPRAMIATGAEARLLRGVLEPVCPVPLIAWPSHGLPGWVGPLDLVVAIAPDGGTPDLVASVHEAVRRGCTLLIACPPQSRIAEYAGSRTTTLLPTTTKDPLAAAVVVLSALHQIQLGPEVRPPAVAEVMDMVAEECSPYEDLAVNPAKDLALTMADATPLLWGGSVLAARAGRRVVEGVRAACGRAALAADARELLTVMEATQTRDVFADPIEDGTDRRPCLLVLDDGHSDQHRQVERNQLLAMADSRDVRVSVISAESGSEMERYVALLQHGLFAAAYLAIGLDRVREE